MTEPTTPRSGILLCEKLQTSEKKRIKSEAANRITPRVSRASKCVLAYEKVTGYMSTLGYMAQYINKSLFPRVASAYSGSPKETARSTHFPFSTAIPRDPPLGDPFTTVGPRSLGRQTATSSGVAAGDILQTLFGSPFQRPMPNQRCQQ